MKKIVVLLASCLINSSIVAERYLVDKIDAVIMGYQNTDVFVELIMRSDSERPNLLGQIVSLEELIKEASYYIDARRLRAVMTEDQIDIAIGTIQHAYNLTKEGFEEVLKGMGYTIEEGRRQLGRMNTVNQLIDIRVTGNIIVEKAEIESYYAEHPAYHDGIYTLQRALMPFEADKELQLQTLKQAVAAHADGLKATWSDSFTVGFAELAPDKSAIRTAQPGSVVLTGPTSEGFEIYRLVSRKEPALKTLAERHDEITDALRKPQAEKLLVAYQESLHKKLVIEYI